MASRVVQSLGKHSYFGYSGYFDFVERAWIPLLLGFLSLSEKFYPTEPPPCPGLTALYILSGSRKSADFCPAILPILSSTLLPTHPLQSRHLALKTFHALVSGWFSSQMKSVLYKDLGKLLQAVGDPFQFTPNPPHRGWASMEILHHEPMDSVVVLIEFASSDLWRKHLRRSNFISCEEVLSTEEGKSAALACMLSTATHTWLTFLHSPVKIVAAIGCLEELQCLNTAEAVIMWAWTTGVMNAVDHDGWKLVGDDTLRFYQTHGIGRLTALKRHITDTIMERKHLSFLMTHYESSPCRMGSVKRPVPSTRPWIEFSHTDLTDLRVSQACQLRRLYHLFGHDLATRKEEVAVEEVDGEMGVSLGRPVIPVPFTDWAYEYP